MRRAAIISAGAMAIVGVGLAVSAATPDPASGLKPVSDFASIADEKQRSLALFGEAGKVIASARCMNCHPAGDRPAQGDDRHPHLPLVVRGIDGFGAVGMRCTTCHGPENFDPARLPGHPEWHLAPIEMAWVGKSLGEICEQIKDPEAQRRQVDGRPRSSHGRRFACRMGLASRRRPHAGARDTGRVWCPHQGLGRYWRRVPGNVSKSQVVLWRGIP